MSAVRAAGLVAGTRATKLAPESNWVGDVGSAQRRPQVKSESKQNAHEVDAGGIAVREGEQNSYGKHGAKSAVVWR